MSTKRSPSPSRLTAVVAAFGPSFFASGTARGMLSSPAFGFSAAGLHAASRPIIARVVKLRMPISCRGVGSRAPGSHPGPRAPYSLDRKSVGEGKSGSGRVELGGRRILKKKKRNKEKIKEH